MDRPIPKSIDEAFAGVNFLAERTPESQDEEFSARVAPYRDGGVFVSHYAGSSEWERHPVGDEIVVVVEGATTMFLLIDGEEVAQAMGPGELVVVPQDTWHRFETPDGVKVVSVTPQPTDHQVDRPG
ncbi:MAG: cupin domain-containing protein [Acidimicrobiales bacterium]